MLIQLTSELSATFATTTAGEIPVLAMMDDAGWKRAWRTISTPRPISLVSASTASRSEAHRINAVPPPGTIPSSAAAFVALSASVTRSLRSLTSTSLPPEKKRNMIYLRTVHGFQIPREYTQKVPRICLTVRLL